jgi:hypothetical protein
VFGRVRAPHVTRKKNHIRHRWRTRAPRPPSPRRRPRHPRSLLRCPPIPTLSFLLQLSKQSQQLSALLSYVIPTISSSRISNGSQVLPSPMGEQQQVDPAASSLPLLLPLRATGRHRGLTGWGSVATSPEQQGVAGATNDHPHPYLSITVATSEPVTFSTEVCVFHIPMMRSRLRPENQGGVGCGGLVGAAGRGGAT